MDLMVDLETMGTSARAAIVSIGAIAFDRGGTIPDGISVDRIGGMGFYTNVDLQSCISLGLEVSGATVMWWLRRDDAARRALTEPKPIPVQEAMQAFARWASSKLTSRTGCIWSHGADFDVRILTEIMDKLGLKPPWQFWNVEHTRTLYREAGIKLPNANERRGGHNAFYDAYLQAQYVQQACTILRTRRGDPEAVAALAAADVEETDL